MSTQFSVLKKVEVTFVNSVIRFEHVPKGATAGAALEMRIDQCVRLDTNRSSLKQFHTVPLLFAALSFMTTWRWKRRLHRAHRKETEAVSDPNRSKQHSPVRTSTFVELTCIWTSSTSSTASRFRLRLSHHKSAWSVKKSQTPQLLLNLCYVSILYILLIVVASMHCHWHPLFNKILQDLSNVTPSSTPGASSSLGKPPRTFPLTSDVKLESKYEFQILLFFPA